MRLRATRITGIRQSSLAAMLSFVLDQLSIQAAAAYSLTCLKANRINLPCINVRRSVDNLAADIGFVFLAGLVRPYILDTATLLAFCGSGSGFVTTWYDQSGSARNATQAAAANQPRIVNAGVLETLGGRTSINFQGKFLQTTAAATWLNGTAYTLNFVGALATGTPALSYALGTTGAANNQGLHFGWRSSTAFTLAQFGSDADFPAAASTNPFTHTAVKNNPSGCSSYLNGGFLGSSGNPGANLSTSGPLNIGTGFNTATQNFYNGKISEVSIFTSALSTTDRQTLERNQGTYYGIIVA